MRAVAQHQHMTLHISDNTTLVDGLNVLNCLALHGVNSNTHATVDQNKISTIVSNTSKLCK